MHKLMHSGFVHWGFEDIKINIMYVLTFTDQRNSVLHCVCVYIFERQQHVKIIVKDK